MTHKTMTVAEAGRKGGKKVRDTYGHEYYVEIGTKGGNRVRELVAAGKRAEGEAARSAPRTSRKVAQRVGPTCGACGRSGHNRRTCQNY